MNSSISTSMNIVWFSWKDLSHPEAGGAEKITHNLLSRLAGDGHKVTLLTSRPEVSGELLPEKVERAGYTIVRGGGRLGVYVQAHNYFNKNFKNKNNRPDLVIDECNTLPFMAKFYVGRKTKSIMFFHMLCREIWFYQLPWYLAWVGYILEPVYLLLLSDMKAITVSESTKKDLVRFSFKKKNINIISEAIEIEPINLLENCNKFEVPTLLSLGSVRAMKRTIDQVKAFELVKEKLPKLRLVIAGDMSDTYGEEVQTYVNKSRYAGDIDILGRVSLEKKTELMRRAHLLLVTSTKEGWGLVVTEANSQGTPAVAYDVDGLRDSIRDGQTGRLTDRNPEALAGGVVETLSDKVKYDTMQTAGYEWSKQLTNERSYRDFVSILEATSVTKPAQETVVS